MKILNLLIFSSLFIAPLARAEIYQCDGSWTNLPCPDGSSEGEGISLKEIPDNSAEEVIASQNRSKKKSLIHDLRMKQILAKREHQVEVSIREAAEGCSEASRSVDECRDLVFKFEERIDNKISSAALVAEKKRANDIKEKEIAKQNHTVVIEQPRRKVYVDLPDSRYQSDGKGFKQRTAVGAAVGGSARGSISGSFSAGTTSSVYTNSSGGSSAQGSTGNRVSPAGKLKIRERRIIKRPKEINTERNKAGASQKEQVDLMLPESMKGH